VCRGLGQNETNTHCAAWVLARARLCSDSAVVAVCCSHLHKRRSSADAVALRDAPRYKRLAIGKKLSRTLKVITIAAMGPYIISVSGLLL